MIERYFNDTTLTRQGNTNSAQFDGWTCVSPTAKAAELAGYGSKCENCNITLIVVPGAAQSAPATRPCTAQAIGEDVGRTVGGAIRCHPNWAYVSWGERGDSQALVRLVDGRWLSFTYCNSPNEAGDDGNSSNQTTSGDLGLSISMTRPQCDGMGIVVVYSTTNPASYGPEVSRALAAHPGASYLRTDQSCPSLRQRSDQGNPIYAV